MSDLWLLPRPLLLASKSQARRSLLAAAGIPFEGIDAQVDERVVELPMREGGADGAAIAALLARAKAKAVSDAQPERLVLGADQTLSIEGRFLTKPPTLEVAKAQLLAMAGRTHTLHAALCLARNGAVFACASAAAHLTCRGFGEAFVDAYLGYAGESVLQSVGGYAVEGLGIHQGLKFSEIYTGFPTTYIVGHCRFLRYML